jgi:transcriptional regulator with XRE-family HTH domain
VPGGRPTIRSRQVAFELRRLRRRSGLTTGEAGARLGISQSKISRIENANFGLKETEVAAMLGLYHVPAERRDKILELVRKAAEPGWWQAYGKRLSEQWQTLIEFESITTGIATFQAMFIPGLLQTSDYARAVIRDSCERDLSDSELGTMCAARTGRQAILTRPDAPTLHAIIYEPALRIPVGEPGVMKRQLDYLVEAAARPNVTVQVVPLAAGPHPGIEGAFMTIDFAGEPALVYLENRVSCIFLEEESHIEAYRLVWERILSVTLSPEDSVEFIRSAAATLT